MPIRDEVRRFAAAAVLVVTPSLTALAQSTQQTPTPPQTPPPTATAPAPESGPKSTNTTPQATAPQPKTNVQNNASALIGLPVFSSDGKRMGTVHSVNSEPGGKIKAIYTKVGGFLGFGGKLVAIPEGKFSKSGENIQLSMSADEVGNLPEAKEQS